MTAPSWDKIRADAARVGLHVVTSSFGRFALWRGHVQVFSCWSADDETTRLILAVQIEWMSDLEVASAAVARGLTVSELAQLVALSDELKEE